MPRDILHEPAETVERLEGGLLTRHSSGRVRAAADGVDPYLFGLLQWQDFAPEVPRGFLRVGVWLEPREGWCEYSCTDRQTHCRLAGQEASR